MTQSNPLPKIANLADLVLTSVANGQAIVWNSGSSKWINADHNSISGLTTGDPHTQYLLAAGTRALTGDQSAGTHKITNLGTPSASTDAATKGYVDTVAQGLDVKASVRVATTANGTLSTAYANGQTVDGVTLATGDRILLKDQSTASQNGIYVVAASGSPARASDMAAAVSAAGAFCFVEEGTANADKGFVCTSNVGSDVVGTNNLAFTQFTGAAGGVTSVDMTVPGIFSISGNPITSSGTLALSLATETANYVWAGPTSGGAATPAFRALVAADLPAMVGDSGSGGTKGAVPAPSTGDAAKFLRGDATWATPSGSGPSYWLNPCIAATTANVNLASGGIASGVTIDGVTLSTGNRVLVWNQSSATENGIYVAPASGAASRASDLPAAATGDNVCVIVGRGTLYHDQAFQQTANGVTVGTDAQTWQAFPRDMVGDSGSGGSSGTVPAPGTGDAAAGKFLKASGAWAVPPGIGTAYNFLRNSTFEFGGRLQDPTSGSNSVSNDNYGLSGWNILCQTGPTYNFQFPGTNARYCNRVQNANGSAKRVGVSQILEAADAMQFRGQSVVFGVRVQSDTATKNLRVAILEWTGTGDAVTSDVVNDWTSATFTTGNFFKSTSLTLVGSARITCTSSATWYSGSVSGTVSSSCNNLIVMVFSEDTFTTNNGITLECPGLYLGATVPTWGSLSKAEEEIRCQRFFYELRGQQYLAGFKIIGAQIQSQYFEFPVRMRATPTGTMVSGLSWVTAGTSGAQVSFTGRVTAGYLTITGALTASCTAYSPDRAIVYFIAATSFSGTIGEVGTLDLGSSLFAYWDAEL